MNKVLATLAVGLALSVSSSEAVPYKPPTPPPVLKPCPPPKPKPPVKPPKKPPVTPPSTSPPASMSSNKGCNGGGCTLPQAFQLWETVTLEKDFGKDDRGVLFFEAVNRNSVDQNYGDKRYLDGHVVELRPMIGYKLTKNLTASVGYAALLYLQPQQFTENDLIQQLQQRKELKHVIITKRWRLEERFFPGMKESTRFRDLTRLDIPTNKKRTWFIVASNEAFVNLNGFDTYTRPGPDQNRAFLGVNHKFSDNLNAEVGYMNQWFMRRNNCDSTMNHAVLMTVNKKL